MIRDKNIFECIFKNNCICFPNYVVWGPPSHGHQRRKHIFEQKFAGMESIVCTKSSWGSLIRNHYDKRKVFEYDEKLKVLSEVDYKSFFTNAYGYIVKEGQRFKCNEETHTIDKLEVIRYAGLIASYKCLEDIKKINVSMMTWNKENNCWENTDRGEAGYGTTGN